MELSDIAQGKSSKEEFLEAIENELKEAVLTYAK
jgi:DNA topoisomerase